jgi:hypothetical protein
LAVQWFKRLGLGRHPPTYPNAISWTIVLPIYIIQ